MLKEVAAYKSALRKFYGSTGRAAVFFERAIAITKSQSHAFVEALPIPQAKADDIGALFIEMGSKVNIDFQVVADFDSVVEETDQGTIQYFCVELPDETCLVHRFSGLSSGHALRTGYHRSTRSDRLTSTSRTFLRWSHLRA